MARFLHHFFSAASRKNLYLTLAYSWIFGLGFGILIFRYAGDSLNALMPGAVCSPLSIACLLGSVLLPFLFSAFAVYISKPGLLLPVCFLKAFLYGYISCGVLFIYGDAGWLVQVLFLFSETAGNALLYFYWLRHIHGFRGFSVFSCIGYLAGYLLIAMVDCGFVAPLLRSCLL